MVDRKKPNKLKELFMEIIFPISGLITCSYVLLDLSTEVFHEKVPDTSEVQRGEVIPGKLEIDLKNIDGVGKKELILTYDGTPYLFTLDSTGRPRIQDYDVVPAKSAEVIPKN